VPVDGADNPQEAHDLMNRSWKQALTVGLVALAIVASSCQQDGGGAGSDDTSASPTATAQQETNGGNGAVAQPLSVVDVVDQVRRSVVHIQAQGLQVGGPGVPSSGVGTGVIWDEDGHIITNNHVVTLQTDQPADRFIVSLTDGRTVDAQLVGRDPLTDLAVIKVDAGDLAPATFGDSDAIHVGEAVVAIGHALDLDGGPTVTTGVVSAVDRSLSGAGGSLSGLVQTDAAINPGNSGGPLVNLQGEVIGINTAAIRDPGNETVQGIGFAVSSNTVKEIARQIIEQGQVRRGTLGVVVQDLTPALARNLGTDAEHGVLVVEVMPDSPAARAGLEPGDAIVKVAGDEVRNLGELGDVLLHHPPGETVEVAYVRGDDARTARVTLTDPQS
jgi:S1-C subfamily serine protease